MNADEKSRRRRDKVELWKLRFSRRPKYWLHIPSTFKLLALILFLSFYYTDEIYQPKVAVHIHKAKHCISKTAKGIAAMFFMTAERGR